jgi:hypothetical protein
LLVAAAVGGAVAVAPPSPTASVVRVRADQSDARTLLAELLGSDNSPLFTDLRVPAQPPALLTAAVPDDDQGIAQSSVMAPPGQPAATDSLISFTTPGLPGSRGVLTPVANNPSSGQQAAAGGRAQQAPASNGQGGGTSNAPVATPALPIITVPAPSVTITVSDGLGASFTYDPNTGPKTVLLGLGNKVGISTNEQAPSTSVGWAGAAQIEGEWLGFTFSLSMRVGLDGKVSGRLVATRPVGTNIVGGKTKLGGGVAFTVDGDGVHLTSGASSASTSKKIKNPKITRLLRVLQSLVPKAFAGVGVQYTPDPSKATSKGGQPIPLGGPTPGRDGRQDRTGSG